MVSRVEARKGLEQILADKAAAREEIEALGGMNLKTGIQNLLAGYNFSSGPRIETTRRRDGTETERIVEGFQLPSSLPDRPEDEGLELNVPYYDENRGEFVYYTRSEPTRNRPQGMLKKNVISLWFWASPEATESLVHALGSKIPLLKFVLLPVPLPAAEVP